MKSTLLQLANHMNDYFNEYICMFLLFFLIFIFIEFLYKKLSQFIKWLRGKLKKKNPVFKYTGPENGVVVITCYGAGGSGGSYKKAIGDP